MDDIYFEAMLTDKVILRPRQIHKNYRTEIKKILKERVEEKCDTYGYIKKDSVEIVRRPIGHIQQGYMNGCVVFDVEFKVMLCNPVYGNVIKMHISMIKKEVGLLFEDEFLSVVVPTELETDKSGFESLEEGDEVDIFVLDKQILPDNTIMVVGKLYNEKVDKEDKVDIGDLKKSEEMREKAMGDSDSDDSDSGNESENDSDAFPDDADDMDSGSESDVESDENNESDIEKADDAETKEIELGDDGEVAIEGEEERDDAALNEKKEKVEADEEGDEDEVPAVGESDDEESDGSGGDEFDYAG